MRVEERVRQAMRTVRPPSVPNDLAEEVLSRLRHRHRLRVTAGSIAAVVAIVIAIPVAAQRLAPNPVGAGSSPVPASPTAQPDSLLPRPGGGPKVVHLYRVAGLSFLLDVARGRYVRIDTPDAALSPDLKRVAISGHDGRLAVIDRAALLEQGEAGLQWTHVTGGSPVWSPDGKSVLVTGNDKSGAGVLLFARRYYVQDAVEVSTPLPGDTAGPARWAPDGDGYLITRYSMRGSPWPQTLQRVEPDGTLGAVVPGDSGGIPGEYSPSGDHLIVDTTQEDRNRPGPPSKILNARSLQAVAETAGTPVGWYDDTRFLRFVADRLEIVDRQTGAVSRIIPTPGLADSHWRGLQIGPSDGLHPDGATYAF